VLTNLGVADYDGLQKQVSYAGTHECMPRVSYNASKATNTTEPDGTA